MESSVHMNLINEDEMVITRDWRKALKAQPAYRIVNRTIKGQTLFTYIVGLTGVFLLIFLYASSSSSSSSNMLKSTSYNYTYPISRPIKTRTEHTFRIGKYIYSKNHVTSKFAKINKLPTYCMTPLV